MVSVWRQVPQVTLLGLEPKVAQQRQGPGQGAFKDGRKAERVGECAV